MTIRAGIIGAGGISRAHQWAYVRVDGFEIVLLIGRRQDNLGSDSEKSRKFRLCFRKYVKDAKRQLLVTSPYRTSKSLEASSWNDIRLFTPINEKI